MIVSFFPGTEALFGRLTEFMATVLMRGIVLRAVYNKRPIKETIKL
jgi:hypothetical protein